MFADIRKFVDLKLSFADIISNNLPSFQKLEYDESYDLPDDDDWYSWESCFVVTTPLTLQRFLLLC